MPARVLVIEDDAEVRLLIKLELERLFLVIEAPDGLAGWKLFQQEKPQCVLTDLALPGMNGLDLMDKIRNHPDLKETPIVVLTGTTTDDDLPTEFWRKGTGADAFFEKPVDWAMLRAEIDRLIKERANYKPLPPGKGYYD